MCKTNKVGLLYQNAFPPTRAITRVINQERILKVSLLKWPKKNFNSPPCLAEILKFSDLKFPKHP